MIRSFFFKSFFYIGFCLICLIFIPTLIMPKKIPSYGGKLVGLWAIFCLKFIMSTKINLKGKENILKNEKFFIACTHQSEFETFYLQTIFKSPYFILKKELLDIPILGSFLKKIGCISINRNKISRENSDFMEKVQNSIKSRTSPLIIFPQGTRYSTSERPTFKKGVDRIYKISKIKCIPIVMNSGDVWPKKGLLIPNKTISISILPAIDPDIENKNFLKDLENRMYSELNNII